MNTKRELNSGRRRKRHEPLFDGGGAIDLGVVLVRRKQDIGRDAKFRRNIEAVKPAVEGLLVAGHGELDLGAVEIVSLGGVAG